MILLGDFLFGLELSWLIVCAFKETKSIGQVFGLYIFCNNNGVCHYSCNEIINKIQQFTIPPPLPPR